MCIMCCPELIAGYYAGQKTTATLLAEKFGLNIRTLNPSLNKMTHAGILRSQVGGVDRGYIFTRDPREISVYDIVEAVEGFSYMKTCEEALDGSKCSKEDCTLCPLFETSAQIRDYTKEQYKKISILDLFLKEKECCAAARGVSKVVVG